MAWRPTRLLIQGELDNTVPGKVTGWMTFIGLEQRVEFNLKGDFHRDIRGTKILFNGPNHQHPEVMVDIVEARDYMRGFMIKQVGEAGDITAGLPPADYTEYPYIEWYSDENGRCVLELDKKDVTVEGKPLPPEKEKPVSRKEQNENMMGFIQVQVFNL